MSLCFFMIERNLMEYVGHTVDGRNHAPPWMVETCWNPINNGINHLSTGAGFLPQYLHDSPWYFKLEASWNGGTPVHHPFRTMGYSMKFLPTSYWATAMAMGIPTICCFESVHFWASSSRHGSPAPGVLAKNRLNYGRLCMVYTYTWYMVPLKHHGPINLIWQYIYIYILNYTYKYIYIYQYFHYYIFIYHKHDYMLQLSPFGPQWSGTSVPWPAERVKFTTSLDHCW